MESSSSCCPGHHALPSSAGQHHDEAYPMDSALPGVPFPLSKWVLAELICEYLTQVSLVASRYGVYSSESVRWYSDEVITYGNCCHSGLAS